jgi:hypothetical protein
MFHRDGGKAESRANLKKLKPLEINNLNALPIK